MHTGNSRWEPIRFDHSEMARAKDEPMGTKEKGWVTRPDGRWLVKYPRRIGTEIAGEDWAEWLAYRIALLLEVPAAVVEPALVTDENGSDQRASATLDIAVGQALTHGNELLRGQNPGYGDSSLRSNPDYTVTAVRSALSGMAPPPGSPVSISTAFDAWAGYLTLDAILSGQDRHDQNWAVLPKTDGFALAPSYDHGNALGFQLLDAKVERILESAGLVAWAARGQAQYFANSPTLTDVATEALSLASAPARAFWLDKGANLTRDDVVALVEQVPAVILSQSRRKFIIGLVMENRRRLLDANNHNLSP